jgi:hypothetical protein
MAVQAEGLVAMAREAIALLGRGFKGVRIPVVERVGSFNAQAVACELRAVWQELLGQTHLRGQRVAPLMAVLAVVPVVTQQAPLVVLAGLLSVGAGPISIVI